MRIRKSITITLLTIATWVPPFATHASEDITSWIITSAPNAVIDQFVSAGAVVLTEHPELKERAIHEYNQLNQRYPSIKRELDKVINTDVESLLTEDGISERFEEIFRSNPELKRRLIIHMNKIRNQAEAFAEDPAITGALKTLAPAALP